MAGDLLGLVGYGSGTEDDEAHSPIGHGGAGAGEAAGEHQGSAEPSEEGDGTQGVLAALLTPGHAAGLESTEAAAALPATATAEAEFAGGAEPQGASPAAAGPGQDDPEAGLPVGFPPAPSAPVDPELQAKWDELNRQQRQTGLRMTKELRDMQRYKNPDFLQKMVDHFGISPLGSCFPKDVFDPDNLPPEDFYDRLAAEFQKDQERRNADRQKAGRIEFAKASSNASDGAAPKGASAAAAVYTTSGGGGGLSSAAFIVAQAKHHAAAVSSGTKRRWDTVPKR